MAGARIVASPQKKPWRWVDWVPLAVLPPASLVVRNNTQPWVFMSVMVLAIYFGCKWLTWRRARRNYVEVGSGNVPCIISAVPSGLQWLRRTGTPVWRSIAYLLAWPGMNASEFFRPTTIPGPKEKRPVPRKREWMFAGTKTFAGVGLLLLAARCPFALNPLLTGWIGMIGLVVFLHFGLFQMLALAWQGIGINITPVMRAPLRAESLAEFWGSRWNTAFSALTNSLVFRPLARRVGVERAAGAVFLVSGLVHEVAISLPARGGYGLPSAYFLLQGCGVLLERGRWGFRFGLGRGWRGRWFMLALIAAPVFWLFHPPFVINVILPMLRAIGTK